MPLSTDFLIFYENNFHILKLNSEYDDNGRIMTGLEYII